MDKEQYYEKLNEIRRIFVQRAQATMNIARTPNSGPGFEFFYKGKSVAYETAAKEIEYRMAKLENEDMPVPPESDPNSSLYLEDEDTFPHSTHTGDYVSAEDAEKFDRMLRSPFE